MEPEDRDGFEDGDGVPDPDNDRDGIADTADRCPLEPETANGYQDDDGCPDEPDTDGDGIVDRVDRCPTDPEDKDGHADDDGCPEDNDADGLLDAVDACPDVAGPPENRGCPDADRDGDTIVDRLDNCPDEPGTAANHGCKEKQLAVLDNGRIEILDVVYFKTSKAVIETRSFPLLDAVAGIIRNHPELPKITIEGHTDDRGNDAYNLDLSQRRAESVRRYLITQGIAGERLDAVGYGETRPIVPNDSNAHRSANRRVEFKLEGVASQRTGPTTETMDPR
ncbi:MAG TPA: OmpA family protein [Kofleriaceae bacterium]|nr:OmpA family protein [Kofleriaceae bacterium]